MKIITNSLLLSLALLLSSCGFPRAASDLYGDYLADYNVAQEKLTLNADGTFTQQVILKATQKTDVVHGTWSYDEKTATVTFNENFMNVLDGFGQLNPDYAQPPKGIVGLPAESHFGQIYLGIDKHVLYKKQ